MAALLVRDRCYQVIDPCKHPNLVKDSLDVFAQWLQSLKP